MRPRVVVVGLASDFGCQVQMTNIEDDLLDVLRVFDVSYWQLASSGEMPDEYDVAIVEGCVTLDGHLALLKDVRERAATVIAMGACAVTGGIPALASGEDLERRYDSVYGSGVPVAAGRRTPAPVSAFIDIDYRIPGCPIETSELLRVLSRALQGLADRVPEEPMCATCKTRENACFIDRGEVCLGPITRAGCGARCVTSGRACAGCRGVSPEANLPSFRATLLSHGLDPEQALSRHALYNTLEEAF